MQTVIQVVCSSGNSLRESIVKDKRLEKFNLSVSSQKTVGRSPGWAKLYSSDYTVPGAMNITWHPASQMLTARVITKGGNKPDKLIGDFITYLLARHQKRIKVINILPE